MFHEQANKLNIQQEVTSRLRQVQEPFSAYSAEARPTQEEISKRQEGSQQTSSY